MPLSSARAASAQARRATVGAAQLIPRRAFDRVVVIADLYAALATSGD